MRLHVPSAAAYLAALLIGTTLPAQEPKERILAGWPGVFPEGFLYHRILEKPKAAKTTWQQTARYEWSGGRAETIRVTLMHNQEEARKIHFDDQNPPPDNVKKIKVGDYTGFEFPNGKLVIDLDKHRLMILEAPTWKLQQSDLPGFARKFNLAACAKALDHPPRTDFARKVELFRELKKGMALAQVSEQVGAADKDIGSGIYVLEYRLDDGARVLIGFPGFERLIYVIHEDKAGKAVYLVK